MASCPESGFAARGVWRIYRFESGLRSHPRLDTYEIDVEACGRDGSGCVDHIKNEIDSTLTFRRSCREGNLRFLCDEHRWSQHPGVTKACADIRGDVRI